MHCVIIGVGEIYAVARGVKYKEFDHDDDRCLYDSRISVFDESLCLINGDKKAV